MNLHRFFVACVAALAMAILPATPAHAQLGIGAGLNFNDLDDIDAGSSSATLDGSTGYHFGVFVNIGSGALSLRPGVFYHQIGTYDFPEGDELDLRAVEVPIDVRLDLAPGSPLGVYLLAGPVVTFPRSGDGDFGEAFQDVSLSADIGAGIGLQLPGVGITIMPEIRYSLGLTDYWSDDFTLGGVTVAPIDDTRRVSSWMIRLNLMF